MGAFFRYAPIYLAAINVLAFLTYGWDKLSAKRSGARRVPERTLFALALLGGSAGAVGGMFFFHHKTRHRSFAVGFPLLLVVQAVALILLIRFGYLQWT